MGIGHLTHTEISIYPYSATAADGSFSYGSAVKYFCRLSSKRHYIRDANNQITVSNSQLYIDGDITIDNRSKILMPDSTYAFIKDVGKVRDGAGKVFYTVVYT